MNIFGWLPIIACLIKNYKYNEIMLSTDQFWITKTAISEGCYGDNSSAILLLLNPETASWSVLYCEKMELNPSQMVQKLMVFVDPNGTEIYRNGICYDQNSSYTTIRGY